MCLEIRHFHRGGLHPAEGYPDLFLACHQRAGYVRQVQCLKLFRGQQPQRTEIKAAAGRLQPLDTFIGLSGIGRPQVQKEVPAHLPGQRIQIPVVLGNRVQQCRPDPFLPFIDGVRFLLQADQRRILFQQPTKTVFGKFLVQRVDQQPRTPVRFPPYG